jgi:hypothetical protein
MDSGEDDDDLTPLDRFDRNDVEELPDPDLDSEDSEVTASRLWRQRALRRDFDFR